MHSEVLALKDAAADNVTIYNGKPIFIDALSFEGRPAGYYLWLAEAQFVRTFIIPLLAFNLCRLRYQPTCHPDQI